MIVGLALQGQGAACEPEAVLPCRFAQKVLYGAVAGGFGNGELVLVAMPHEAEIFGHNGQFCTLVCRLLQQACGGGEVAGNVGAGDHLNRGNLHGGWLFEQMVGAGGYAPEAPVRASGFKCSVAVGGGGKAWPACGTWACC